MAGQEELRKQLMDHEFRINEIYSFLASSEDESKTPRKERLLKSASRTPGAT